MKLASFAVAGHASWGAVLDDEIADLGAVLGGTYAGLRGVLEAAALAALPAALADAPRLPLANITWLPVIPTPGKIICIGLNYETHVKETGRDPSAYPAIFTRFADTQIGHGAPIIRPRVSRALDYEGELAIIIGEAGRYIPRETAMRQVAGYAPYNDASVRDWQRHTIQFTPGKNFPATGPFGPWMVTADEIPDITKLGLTTRLNGVVMQQAGFDQLIFPIDEIIAYVSSFTELRPGDVIATGTPGGVGFKRQPPVFMAPGDVIEVDIPGIGRLANPIIDEA